MAGAEWVRWIFAGMFAVLALYYLIRLLSSPPAASWGVDGSRSVVSLGMVAMLVPQLDPLPRLSWLVLFGLAAGYIAVRLIRRGLCTAPASRPALDGHHELHLVVGGLAMAYMFAAMPAERDMSHGMDTAGTGSTSFALPILTWAFVAYFLVFVVWLSARLAVPGCLPVVTPLRGVVGSPHLLGSSEIVMGIGMSYMLITTR
jgi:Domain of unknown function (DUF5134)